MILSGKKIEEEINNKNIVIKPFNNKKTNPNSYNLTLSNELVVYESNVLDIKENNITKNILIPEDGLILFPGKLYLGRTNESTFSKKYVPMIEGRSSVGRLGIFIHITAGFGDVGFNGFWTLEISCIQPIKIYPDIEICQIYFHEVLGEITTYKGKYQDNNKIQPSLLYKEFS